MIDIPKLRAFIQTIDLRHDETWSRANLEQRKIDELRFHDAYRNRSDEGAAVTAGGDTFEVLTENKKYYKTVKLSEEYIDSWLSKNIRNKVFLDYACGDGKYAIRAARDYGAAVSVGFDLSGESVNNAEADAEDAGVTEKTIFFQGDAECTKLENDSVDVIICSGMLHHLDLNNAFPELFRILKPQGVVFCIEALDYNPAIKAYRLLTPRMRTEWEKLHILSHKDLKFASKWFSVEHVRYFHILAPASAFFSWAAPLLDFIDEKILTRIPLIRLLSWIFIFELRKP